MGGKPVLAVKDIAARLGRPEFYVRKKMKELYNKIIEARNNAGY